MSTDSAIHCGDAIISTDIHDSMHGNMVLSINVSRFSVMHNEKLFGGDQDKMTLFLRPEQMEELVANINRQYAEYKKTICVKCDFCKHRECKYGWTYPTCENMEQPPNPEPYLKYNEDGGQDR